MAVYLHGMGFAPFPQNRAKLWRVHLNTNRRAYPSKGGIAVDATNPGNTGRLGGKTSSAKCEIKKLESCVSSLLNDPPPSAYDLEHRYEEIRKIIADIETTKQELAHVLKGLDADFQPVRRIYPYQSPGFLSRVGTSVLANEYRFFVGSLQAYVQGIEETYAR